MAPKTPPGQTRRQIFHFMRERLLSGRPPTIREVQEAFKFRSVQSAREHLEALVSEGKLIKQPGVSRGYKLPLAPDTPPTALIPLLGRVQAGELSLALEDPDGYISVQTQNRADDLFALRIRGESMIGAGILPKDIVIVRKQPSAESGDIVVALVGEEATVKTLRLRKGKIILQPENPEFEPIIPNQNDLVILGKIIEVRRYLEEHG